ncbi:SG1D salivary protein precursor [Anopheles sinensis]|uniref:SG1D salivary protein n=1 Tax=Anopheles sinensis TaxID=74873 RepID=A0A084VLJ0_ANOSI|nr:SG1D salivary protein precursor [Anopheles sinensis]
MGVCTVRGSLVALIVVTIHCAASQPEEKKSKDYFCILKEQASSKQPPAVCQPLEACDPAPLLQHYDNVQKECQVSASKRRDDKAGFPFQLDYWYGDLLFLFDGLKNKTLESASLFVEAERIEKANAPTTLELEQKHFVYSIEAGRLQDALLAYLTMPTQMTPNEIVTVISGNPKVNEAVLLNYLYFVRAIPDRSQRLEFYKAFKPVLYKHNLNATYMALVYSVEVFHYVNGTNDYKTYHEDISTPFIVKCKELMMQNRYAEILWVEKHFPDYFAFEIPLFTSFNRDEWKVKLDQKQLYEQANNLARIRNRLRVFERIVEKTYVHGVGGYNIPYADALGMLQSLANQVDKLESALVKDGKDPKLMKRLKEVQDSFVKLHKVLSFRYIPIKPSKPLLIVDDFLEQGQLRLQRAKRSDNIIYAARQILRGSHSASHRVSIDVFVQTFQLVNFSIGDVRLSVSLAGNERCCNL